MKKVIVIGLAVVLGIGLIGYAVADSGPGGGRGMMGGGHMGSGWGMMGGGHMGPGWMMRGSMGPGQMGPGYAPCRQFSGTATGEKLTKEKAETLVKRQLAMMGNPNLKLGTVKEETDRFVAEIVTKEDSLVDRLQIDKRTGFIRPIR